MDFYNNSKATSVDATLKSLEAFERGVHLIMGGKDKGAPYTPLLPLIKERVREVLLIGAAAPVIAEQLAGSTELVQAGDLATAVYEAFARVAPGRHGAAGAGLLELRSVPGLRRARPRVQRAGEAARAGCGGGRVFGCGTRDTGHGTRGPDTGSRETEVGVTGSAENRQWRRLRNPELDRMSPNR